MQISTKTKVYTTQSSFQASNELPATVLIRQRRKKEKEAYLILPDVETSDGSFVNEYEWG